MCTYVCAMCVYCVRMCIMYGETDRRRSVEICMCVFASVGFEVGGVGCDSLDSCRKSTRTEAKKKIDGARQKVEVENEGSSVDSGTT